MGWGSSQGCAAQRIEGCLAFLELWRGAIAESRVVALVNLGLDVNCLGVQEEISAVRNMKKHMD